MICPSNYTVPAPTLVRCLLVNHPSASLDRILSTRILSHRGQESCAHGNEIFVEASAESCFSALCSRGAWLFERCGVTIGTIGQPFWGRKNALSFVPIVTGSRRQAIFLEKIYDLSDLQRPLWSPWGLCPPIVYKEENFPSCRKPMSPTLKKDQRPLITPSNSLYRHSHQKRKDHYL